MINKRRGTGGPGHEDPSLARLLDTVGIYDMTQGYWVEIQARSVPPSPHTPYGVDYSLTLHGPAGQRLIGYDNAHPVKTKTGPAGASSRTIDHRHRGKRVTGYAYSDAETLLEDFWADVRRKLKEEGVP